MNAHHALVTTIYIKTFATPHVLVGITKMAQQNHVKNAILRAKHVSIVPKLAVFLAPSGTISFYRYVIAPVHHIYFQI